MASESDSETDPDEEKIPGSFNTYGSEGPAVLSKFARKFTVTTADECHSATGNTFMVIGHDGGDSQVVQKICSSDLKGCIESGYYVLPFANTSQLNCIAEQYGATRAECAAQIPGLGMAIYGNICEGGLLDVTCIVKLQRFADMLSQGRNPAGISTPQLAILRDMGQVFHHSVPDALPTPALLEDTGPSCIVCMNHPPQYRWRGCLHDNDGSRLLLCGQCANVIRRRESGSVSIRGRAAPSLPCYLCRKVSCLINKKPARH